MIKRTLYFGNPSYLSLKDKQLLLKLPEVENQNNLPESFKQQASRSIPIEDIGVVILDHLQITLTHGLIEALLDNNVALITCDTKHLPVGLMLPLVGNSTQTERFTHQINASLPLKKQLWQQSIQQKILNQATVLKKQGAEIQNMIHWANSVKSGDTDNHEARAAAYYWSHLFPSNPEFLRRRDAEDENVLFNYAYAILRAIVARALVGSGLLPTLGIHHHNKYNAYCLADDIMEPYRPFADQVVLQSCKQLGHTDLSKEMKAALLSIPTIDVTIGGDRSPLMVGVQRTTASLYKCFSGELRKITYPELQG